MHLLVSTDGGLMSGGHGSCRDPRPRSIRAVLTMVLRQEQKSSVRGIE
jgi:hypothetical protein